MVVYPPVTENLDINVENRLLQDLAISDLYSINYLGFSIRNKTNIIQLAG